MSPEHSSRISVPASNAARASASAPLSSVLRHLVPAVSRQSQKREPPTMRLPFESNTAKTVLCRRLHGAMGRLGQRAGRRLRVAALPNFGGGSGGQLGRLTEKF
eukprot:scaffold2925_cov62-Phaeocystis_antarctica.AAC.3